MYCMFHYVLVGSQTMSALYSLRSLLNDLGAMERWCHVRPGTMLCWHAKYLEIDNTSQCCLRLSAWRQVRQTPGICACLAHNSRPNSVPSIQRRCVQWPIHQGVYRAGNHKISVLNQHIQRLQVAFSSLASPIRSCRCGQHSVTNSLILIACVNHFTVLRQKKPSKAIVFWMPRSTLIDKH